jgi:Tetratricopeptide repeat
MARACVALALAACLAQAVRQTAATAIAKRNTPEALRRAERWDPSGPEIPARLARALAAQGAGGDPEEIAGGFHAATRLGPHRAENWAALGDALEVAGNAPGAKQAYQRALALYPRSPAFNWQFANFLIRQGDTAEAAAALQRAIEGDPGLRMGAFDLAWRAGMPAPQILKIVPARRDDRAAYLDYLTENGRLDAAADVWRELVESPAAFDEDAAFRYFDALLAAHRVDELTSMWAQLARHDPQRIHWRPDAKERITNGGFDAPLTGGGFGWRVPAVVGADASLDSVVYHDAAPSLCVHFDGTHNLNFGQVAQYAAVEPHTKYDFTAYARTEGITTDSGPLLAVYDPLDHAALWVETPMLIGTTSWQELELTFRTGPETRIVVVQALRRPSEKFDDLIGGTMWLDDVSLRAIP